MQSRRYETSWPPGSGILRSFLEMDMSTDARQSEFEQAELPVGTQLDVSFEKGHRGPIAYANKKVCLPSRDWDRADPKPAQRWKVQITGNTSTGNAYIIMPIEFLGTDEDALLPEPDQVTFEGTDDDPVARYKGRICIPRKGSWEFQAPKPGERWKVEFAAQNPKRTAYFIVPIKFIDRFHPQDEMPDIPSRLVVALDEDPANNWGVVAYIAQKVAYFDEMPNPPQQMRPGQRWLVEIISSNEDSHRLRPLVCLDDISNGDTDYVHPYGLPMRQRVDFKTDKSGDGVVGFASNGELGAGGKAIFPDRKFWTVRRPLPGESWRVDFVEERKNIFFVIPVCRVR